MKQSDNTATIEEILKVNYLYKPTIYTAKEKERKGQTPWN